MEEKRNKGGFKVPEGYFNSLKSRLSDTVSDRGVRLPEKEGFVVPEGYLEGLNGRIMSRVLPPGPKVISFNSYKKYALVAAAVAVIAMLFVLMPREEKTTLGFEDLAGTDIAAYMEFSEPDFTDDEIAELFPVGEIEMNDILESSLAEEHIMDYLDTSMEDYEELNFEIDD
jgi:hypothetical protein